MNQQSPARNWELRCRFLVALVWILGIGVMQHPRLICAAGVVLLGMLIFIAVPISRVIRNLIIVSPFLVVSFITLSLSDGFPVSQNAVDFAALISLRMAVCVLPVCLVFGNDIQDYLNAFHAMRFPSALTSTLFLTQRYVHVIGRQFSVTIKSLASRLFSSRIRMKTFNVYGQIFGGLMIHAIDRSDHIHKAMESRGFHGKMRTGKAAPIRQYDVLKSVGAIVLLVAFLIVERWFA